MSVDRELVDRLLERSEGDCLDFKVEPYDLGKADCDFLKDLLAMANVARREDAHIILGVREEDGRAAEIVGIKEHPKDHSLQQYANHEKRLNRRVIFDYTAVPVDDDKEVGVIRIRPVERRPIYLRRGAKVATVEPEKVYIRRGSSTNVATPDDIADMGRDPAAKEPTSEELLREWGEAGKLPSFEIGFRSESRGDTWTAELSLRVVNGVTVRNVFLSTPDETFCKFLGSLYKGQPGGQATINAHAPVEVLILRYGLVSTALLEDEFRLEAEAIYLHHARRLVTRTGVVLG